MRFPEKYADKYVTVVGEYSYRNETWIVDLNNRTLEINVSGMIRGGSARFGEVPVSLPFTLINGTNIFPLIQGHEYQWSGVFRYTGKMTDSTGGSWLKGMILEVSRVESR